MFSTGVRLYLSYYEAYKVDFDMKDNYQTISPIFCT